MGLFDSARVLTGIALIVVGTLLLVPGIFPSVSPMVTYGLVLAAALLTLGTWLVGTAEGSPAV